MVADADLYSILIAYANKNNSPQIRVASILDYLEKSARKYSEDYPLWRKWEQNLEETFWMEISDLEVEGKCELLSASKNGLIFMSAFYTEKLIGAYKYIEEHIDVPFPNEESLRIVFPESQKGRLSPGNELVSFLAEPGNNDGPILRIVFPDSFGSALVLHQMVPRHLTAIALLKLQNYLRKYGNKEYSYHKLVSLLQGKEAFIKEQIEKATTSPVELFTTLEESGEPTFTFWAHFCSLVKNDLKKKHERLSTDIATFQAVHIIEVINSHFKSMYVKRREKEIAFKNLESQLSKHPYLYSMAEIIKFVGVNGMPLLNQYSATELEEWIRNRSTESVNDELPVLLIMSGPNKGEHYFLLKDKMLVLFARFLTDARYLIKTKISKQWSRLILDFKKESSMTDDLEFEKLLFKTAEKTSPDLTAMLEDPKFSVVYQEMERKENGIPPTAKVFYEGKLLSYSSMFLVRRKDLLLEVKLSLPLWYSLPIISSIFGFFKKLSKKKKAAASDNSAEAEDEQINQAEKGHTGDIKAAVEELELEMLPPGHTMDLYLRELEDRWGHLLNKKAQENLTNDVKFLVRDSLRRTMKLQKYFKPTREVIRQMADSIIIHNQTLTSIKSRDALISYIELYLVKLLQNQR